MEDLISLRADLKDLLLSQQFATLASTGDGYPNTGLVVYIYSSEEEKLYFAINKKDELYHNIKSNPHVSLLIDNAKSGSIDHLDVQSISLLGKAQELYDYKKELHIVRFLESFSGLSTLLHDDNCTIIETHVHKYIFSNKLGDSIAFDHF